MDIKVNISEKQVQFLKQFADRQHDGGKDNLGTYKPIHIVQSMVPIIIHGAVTPECYATKYYSKDSGTYYDTPEELVAKVKKIDDVIPLRGLLGKIFIIKPVVMCMMEQRLRVSRWASGAVRTFYGILFRTTLRLLAFTAI